MESCDAFKTLRINQSRLYMYKTLLQMSSGTHGPPSVTLTMELKYKGFCWGAYTILKSDYINNIDHMRISGIEPA